MVKPVVHLTNVAVQKTAPDYDPEKGCKWSIIRLREYMTAKYGAEKASSVLSFNSEQFASKDIFCEKRLLKRKFELTAWRRRAGQRTAQEKVRIDNLKMKKYSTYMSFKYSEIKFMTKIELRQLTPCHFKEVFFTFFFNFLSGRRAVSTNWQHLQQKFACCAKNYDKWQALLRAIWLWHSVGRKLEGKESGHYCFCNS